MIVVDGLGAFSVGTTSLQLGFKSSGSAFAPTGLPGTSASITNLVQSSSDPSPTPSFDVHPVDAATGNVLVKPTASVEPPAGRLPLKLEFFRDVIGKRPTARATSVTPATKTTRTLASATPSASSTPLLLVVAVVAGLVFLLRK